MNFREVETCIGCVHSHVVGDGDRRKLACKITDNEPSCMCVCDLRVPEPEITEEEMIAEIDKKLNEKRIANSKAEADILLEQQKEAMRAEEEEGDEQKSYKEVPNWFNKVEKDLIFFIRENKVKVSGVEVIVKEQKDCYVIYVEWKDCYIIQPRKYFKPETKADAERKANAMAERFKLLLSEYC